MSRGITDAAIGLSLFDVFLLTSKFEGTPNIVLEASALGIPVIAPLVDRIEEYRRTLRVCLIACAAIAVVGSVLDSGAWSRQETFFGPFRTTSAESKLFAVELGDGVPFWLNLRLDDARRGAAPNPRLESAAQEIVLPDPPGTELYQGFAYWLGNRTRDLSFELPDGVTNGNQLALTVRYFVRLHSNLLDVGRWGTAFILLLFGARALDRAQDVTANRRSNDWKSVTVRGIARSLPVAGFLIVASCMVYLASIVYGIFSGDALPTSTFFRLVPGDIAARIEPYLPISVVVFAATGASLSWAATLRLVPVEEIQGIERSLIRSLAVWGLPVISSLFLFSLSAGGWSGHSRPFDENYFSIAGLVAHSDARAYFSDAYRQAFLGGWDVLGSRRPLGEAFRQLTVFAAQYSYAGTLLVQAGLAAIALFLAARSVARWHGVWAGIAFVGFTYILVRPFLSTTLTEPLALILSLLTIVVLLDALRLKSLPHALIALTGLTFALLTRMGSMFTIPFMIIWIVLTFARNFRARLALLVGACGIVGAIVAINGALALLYASPGVSTGSNFAWTACGLSFGMDWSYCSRIYQADLQVMPNERAAASFLLMKAWENIRNDPSVVLFALSDHAAGYVKNMPQFLFNGYGRYVPYELSATIAQIVAVALVASGLYVNCVRATMAERQFWLFLFISVVMSAAIVLSDDGWRVLVVTNGFMALFFATGFAAPTTLITAGTAPTWSWRSGAAAAAVMSVLLLTVPALSHFLTISEIAKHPAIGTPPAGKIIVPGGRFISGFVVIKDGAVRPVNVPTFYVSDFVNMMRLSGMENDLGSFVQDVISRAPFAFILGGQLGDTDQSRIYIAPPVVLERTEVWAWRFKLRVWLPGEKPWTTLREAVTVEPLP